MVMTNWFNDTENKNRLKANNIQNVYDTIGENSPNTSSFLEFTAYILNISLHHDR